MGDFANSGARVHFADRTLKFLQLLDKFTVSNSTGYSYNKKTGYSYSIVYFPLFKHTYRKNTPKSSIHALLF